MTPLLRNILFGIGALALIAGILVGVMWLRGGTNADTSDAIDKRTNVLVAARPIDAGTLLREGDMTWQPITTPQPQAGSFVRGVNSKTELVGALTRRNLSVGEVLNSTALLRPNERGFLAATLVPGYRAVTIPIDARQSASGLVLPGDRVDVILVQNLADATPAHKSVGETVLSNARVLAVGHVLGPVQEQEDASSNAGIVSRPERVTPSTITLEALPLEAQRLFVAGEIGTLELALRPVGEPAGTVSPAVSVWAGDVSNALGIAPPKLPSTAGTSTAGSASGYRRETSTVGPVAASQPVLIIRGSRGGGK